LGVAKLFQVMDDHLSIETNGFTMGSPKALRIGDLNPRLCGCFFVLIFQHMFRIFLVSVKVEHKHFKIDSS
jgi:hypothetical protein